MRKAGFGVLLILTVFVFGARAAGAKQDRERDVFAFVQALDEAGAKDMWPGFKPSEWPIALFDGKQTILLHHPSPPPEFIPLPGRSGVLATAGRYPAVAANSTREIGGVRTATVIATPAQAIERTMLACLEEVFHVFWLRRHANFRPNEMARYSYPVKDEWNVARLLSEDEALARALEAAGTAESSAWTAAAFAIRRDRIRRLNDDHKAFETGLEMMEGTANYVARTAVGMKPEATALRLRSARQPDGIRWRFYETGTAICLLLDRLQPGWKVRIDAEPGQTTADLLEAAVARSGAPAASFSTADLSRVESRAASDVAELSARQRQLRKELLGRAGARIVVEIPAGAEPLRVTRFDPVNLLVLDEGEVIHEDYITLASPDGTIELTNPGFARGSYAGTVALTRGAGHHPLADGIRMLTIAGVRGTPKINRSEGRLTLEAEGVRVALAGADVHATGETMRVVLPAAKSGPSSPSPQKPDLALTYVANAGVLAVCGDSRILIDALFDKPNPEYRAPATETLERIMKGAAPFDHVTAVLVTHNHPDHFDARLASRYMETFPDAWLLAPSDAVAEMRNVATDWTRIARRVVSIDLAVGGRVRRDAGGVAVTALRTLHSGNQPSPLNVMYLVEMHGRRLLHEGDSPGATRDYRGFGLADVPIDLALVHFWFPLDPTLARFLQEGLKAGHIALTHLPIRLEGDAPGKIDQVRKYYKDIFLLVPGMQTRTF